MQIHILQHPGCGDQERRAELNVPLWTAVIYFLGHDLIRKCWLSFLGTAAHFMHFALFASAVSPDIAGFRTLVHFHQISVGQ